MAQTTVNKYEIDSTQFFMAYHFNDIGAAYYRTGYHCQRVFWQSLGACSCDFGAQFGGRSCHNDELYR